MITMQPAIRYGRGVRDRALLPDDEYVARSLELRAALHASDLDALVVFGHAAAGGAFNYIAGLVPSMGFSGLVVTADGEPILVSASGPRDVPFYRAQTWIADVRASPSLLEDPVAGVAAAVGERCGSGARIGLVEAEKNVDVRSLLRLHEALAGYELADGTAVVESLRRRKRPRELAAIGRAAEVAFAAAEAGVEVGGSALGSAVEVQRAARVAGAHDVRVLVGRDGRFLPLGSAALPALSGNITLYCAVELSGYWAEAIAGPEGESAETLRKLAALLVPGARGIAIAEAAAEARLAVSHGVGGGIGTEQLETPLIAAGSADTLKAGDVVALRALTPDSCAGGIYRVVEQGPVRL